MTDYLVAIDQGTSSTRTVVFDRGARVVSSAQQEFAQIYPHPGWVEHDPEAIWRSVLDVTRRAFDTSGAAQGEVAGLGITNQRETTLIWDRETGACVYNAIVWQDRRTAAECQRLRGEGLEQTVIDRTGLRLDPYFSATKIAWVLENVADAARLVGGTDEDVVDPSGLFLFEIETVTRRNRPRVRRLRHGLGITQERLRQRNGLGIRP